MTHDNPVQHSFPLWLHLGICLPLGSKFVQINSTHFKTRGYSHVRGIRVCAALTTPFLGSSATPETHLFKNLVLVLIPSVFRVLKYLAFLGPFLSDFGKISAPNTLIVAKSCSQGPKKRSIL